MSDKGARTARRSVTLSGVAVVDERTTARVRVSVTSTSAVRK
ncbi:hypothetical protein [Haladaptatus sp. NG-WS-4]